MKPTEFWKNFNLGAELGISGSFIYNGVRRFHEMRTLDHSDEIFEVLYNLSVGLERLLKVTVVLLEHSDTDDITALERSLITHSHLELLQRVKAKADLKLAGPHNEFLALLTTFYKSLRYDRFSLSSVYDPDKETRSLREFVSKYLSVDLEAKDSLFATANDPRYSRFVRKLVIKISTSLYELIRDQAGRLNIYTYELRSGSKAETVFLGKADIPTEEVLWKELLVFFMNTDSRHGILGFMKGIEPLDFDPGMATEYLECFQSDAAKGPISGELEQHYLELEDPGERLRMMSVIGNPDVYFDEPGGEGDEEAS